MAIEAGVRVLLKTGVGLTTTVTVFVAGFVQPLAVRVYTYPTLIGALVLLLSVSLMLPEPVAAPPLEIPATIVLDQLKLAPAVALVAI